MKVPGKKTALIVLSSAFSIVCAALYAYIYIVPSVTGALTATSIVRYGEMLTENFADCIVIRSEKLVNARHSGNTGYYVEEGEKTRKGVKVADIYPAGASASGYFMESTAIVSYFSDGMEGVYTPEILDELSPSDFTPEDEEGFPVPSDVRASAKAAGEPLFKIISSDIWYMALLVEEKYIDEYKIGHSVDVDFGDGVVSAVIENMSKFEKQWIIITSTRFYYSEFQKLRHCKVQVVTQDNSGLIIPTSARAMKENEEGQLQEGVYVRNIKGEFDFRRIRLLAEDETSGLSLVNSDSFYEKDAEGNTVKVSTIKVYDEILRDAAGLSDVPLSDEEPAAEEEIVFEWEKSRELRI